ncbi:5'-nucleotidase, lipoprotein e(P4) family [Paraurantiacibacter namhicola]|uniref:Lipoprotein E n=1 Tax=Paraurantiacibacter namhicola TaxID=645517 RepID=A0A1C7D4Z0_9SPHN|nr:HAD family acid phosphatase [Paraurantiacibacter namhicola]ANU06535.1 Lipoprotein E precursor [Paraurantiacibacter namhicola]
MRALMLASAALLLGGCVSVTDNSTDLMVEPAIEQAQAGPGGERDAPDSMRWLYGSGEAAVASLQAFDALGDFVERRAGSRPASSVAMGLDGRIGETPCTRDDGTPKPLAVVFDVDETLLLNSGYEYWQAREGVGYDSAVWDEWERTGAALVEPVPGSLDAVRRIRAAGVTVIFNTNRASKNAAATAAALDGAGFGPAIHRENLWLKGDDAKGSEKDGRRMVIAQDYCVIALVGDNLGDFADVYNDRNRSVQARRTLAASEETAGLWGNGWFLLPNPVYGASIRGSVDDVFPPDVRWEPAEPISDEGE